MPINENPTTSEMAGPRLADQVDMRCFIAGDFIYLKIAWWRVSGFVSCFEFFAVGLMSFTLFYCHRIKFLQTVNLIFTFYRSESVYLKGQRLCGDRLQELRAPFYSKNFGPLLGHPVYSMARYFRKMLTYYRPIITPNPRWVAHRK